MLKVATPLEGVFVLEPDVHEDSRGFFIEAWNDEAFRRDVCDVGFVQDNHSRSLCGVVRGLHLQRGVGKLVSVVSGFIFDVAVDMRVGSATFGKWYGTQLSGENHRMMWIPAGFAHGFKVISESADVCYKVTGYWRASDEVTVKWDDHEIGIDWPMDYMRDARLSARDAEAKSLSESIVSIRRQEDHARHQNAC